MTVIKGFTTAKAKGSHTVNHLLPSLDCLITKTSLPHLLAAKSMNPTMIDTTMTTRNMAEAGTSPPYAGKQTHR